MMKKEIKAIQQSHRVKIKEKREGTYKIPMLLQGNNCFSVTARKGFTNKIRLLQPSCIFGSEAIYSVVLLVQRKGEMKKLFLIQNLHPWLQPKSYRKQL